MKNKRFCLLMLLIISLSTEIILAFPALRTPFKVAQPDGKLITICLYGDEFFNYRTTVDGYPIALNGDGYYTYAILDDKGSFIPSSCIVNENRTANEDIFLKQNKIRKTVDTDIIRRKTTCSKANEMLRSSSKKIFPAQGSPKSLVILVNYADLSFISPDSQETIIRLLNEKGYSENGATGSVRDYFRDNSMGIFEPEFVVVGPYTLPQPRVFYGGGYNSSNNYRQMAKDACGLAAKNGVDFSKYDYNDDGFVDNVFIYYAGDNEATGGSVDSVWPHRWWMEDESTVYNGKIIYDYACTSELIYPWYKKISGIGIFAHEFSHVLGLKDYSGAGGDPVSDWDIMGSGGNLNEGRTPSYYSAYNRFFLGWLKPVELNDYRECIRLDTLGISNTAYLISKDGKHNLDGRNPQPQEFFLLENRQLSGWDKYMGMWTSRRDNHGLIITRIRFDSYVWEINEINAIYEDKRYVIMENGKTGNPFPGSKNVSYFYPLLHSGEDIGKPISNIREENGIITFQFMGTVNGIEDIGVKEDMLHDLLNNPDKLPIEVYDIMGSLVDIIPYGADISDITNLSSKRIYILCAGKQKVKIAL